MKRSQRQRLDKALNKKHPPMAGGPGRPLWQRWGAFLMLLAAMALLIGLSKL